MKRGPFKHPYPLKQGQLLKANDGTIYQVKQPVNDTFNGHIVTLEAISYLPEPSELLDAVTAKGTTYELSITEEFKCASEFAAQVNRTARKYFNFALSYSMSRQALIDFLKLPMQEEISRWEDDGGMCR